MSCCSYVISSHPLSLWAIDIPSELLATSMLKYSYLNVLTLKYLLLVFSYSCTILRLLEWYKNKRTQNDSVRDEQLKQRVI